MGKSFEIRFPFESEYEKLKELWQTAFDDSKESLDYFFKNTVSPLRVLAAFKDNKPVSALYMLESEILIKSKIYSAYYIYAVCTHPDFRGQGLMKSLFEELFKVAKSRNIGYLFLVPEEEYLFEIYKKIGFQTGFFYSQKEIYASDFQKEGTKRTENITYEKYRNCITENQIKVPFAILKKSTFNSFFNSVSGEINVVFIEKEGYAIYEETEETLTVFELFGNENPILSEIFRNSEKGSLIYRKQANKNPIPYGMYYRINDVPEIQNGFFGIPYSN